MGKTVNKKQISFRLHIEALAQIEKLAKKEKRNRSNMIEFILREYLTGKGKP